MDNSDTERFIKEIKIRPCIWDASSVDYSNRDLRKKCWDEIIKIFGPEKMSLLEKRELGRILQKRWKGIRGCYTREINRKKLLKSGSDAGPRKSEYTYFQQLQFLQSVVTVRESDNEDGSSEIIEAKKATKRINRLEKKTDLEYEPKERKREKPLLEEQDEDRLFLLSLLSTLKRVPQDKKMGVKIRMMTVLDEATKDNIQEDTSHMDHSYRNQTYAFDTTWTQNTGHAVYTDSVPLSQEIEDVKEQF